MALQMTRPWIKAVVVCAVLSTVFVLGASILFGGGRSFPSEIEWERVNEMKYQEAQDYLYRRAQRMSGWEAFVQGAQSPWYWQQLFYGWLASFVFGLICCGALLRWLKVARAPSNTTPHADARDVPASAGGSGARASERER
jgi:hypothetical protein